MAYLKKNSAFEKKLFKSCVSDIHTVLISIGAECVAPQWLKNELVTRCVHFTKLELNDVDNTSYEN